MLVKQNQLAGKEQKLQLKLKLIKAENANLKEQVRADLAKHNDDVKQMTDSFTKNREEL